jgi:CBS domain-containing protein
MSICETIGDMRVGVRDVVTIVQFDRVTNAAEIMCENRVGSLVVIAGSDDETMVGIISERDILQWIGRASPDTFFQQVEDVMTREVVSCEADSPLEEGWKLMKNNRIRHIPIVSDGVAVAMLSARDLLDLHHAQQPVE